MTNYAPCLVLVLSGECEHDLNIPVIKSRYTKTLRSCSRVANKKGENSKTTNFFREIAICFSLLVHSGRLAGGVKSMLLSVITGMVQSAQESPAPATAAPLYFIASDYDLRQEGISQE